MTQKLIMYFEPVIQEYKEILEKNTPKGFKMCYWEEIPENERQKKLTEVEYFLVVSSVVDKKLIENAHNLRHIQRTGIGYDNIDIKTANKFGITVSNFPTGNSVAAAEHAILLILAVYRNLININNDTKEGKWPLWKYRTKSYEMDGKIHGFIGFGNIGRETAKRSISFGTKIIYYDLIRATREIENAYSATFLSFEEVICKSDILSIHVPLTPENQGLIGREEINMMKKDAILINISRGGLVDEMALYEALKRGDLSGAGIDTWENEPVISNNP